MIILSLKDVKLPRVNEKYNKNFSLTDSYRTGLTNLVWRIKIQCEGLPKIKPPYAVNILVGTHKDGDSFLKPLFDAMQTAKIIDNDKNILYYSVEKEELKRSQQNYIEVDLSHYEKRKN